MHRACNAARGQTRKVYSKGRHVLFFDEPNLLKKISNKLTRILDLTLRDGTVRPPAGALDIHCRSRRSPT